MGTLILAGSGHQAITLLSYTGHIFLFIIFAEVDLCIGDSKAPSSCAKARRELSCKLIWTGDL